MLAFHLRDELPVYFRYVCALIFGDFFRGNFLSLNGLNDVKLADHEMVGLMKRRVDGALMIGQLTGLANDWLEAK